jgi:hypothetical protein
MPQFPSPKSTPMKYTILLKILVRQLMQILPNKLYSYNIYLILK